MNIIATTKNLWHRYPGQTQPQPVYLEIYPKSKTLRVDWSGEIGNAVPMDVWHNVRLRYALRGVPTVEAANALMAEVAPLAERIIAGHNVRWDGNNHRGYLDDDAAAAENELEAAICSSMDGYDSQLVWDEESISEYELREITAETTDAEIAELVAEIEQSAAADYAVLDFDTQEVLERRRAEAIAERAE